MLSKQNFLYSELHEVTHKYYFDSLLTCNSWQRGTMKRSLPWILYLQSSLNSLHEFQVSYLRPIPCYYHKTLSLIGKWNKKAINIISIQICTITVSLADERMWKKDIQGQYIGHWKTTTGGVILKLEEKMVDNELRS